LTARIARRRGFSCLHRYEIGEWTEEQNRQVFGACFTPQGHGHNYELEVYLDGEVDPRTGMILNLVDVDRVLEEVIQPVNGRHLNFEVPEFSDKVPTTELLAEYLFARCAQEFSGLNVHLVKLRLFEYEDLWVDVWPD
jgi:6-pyruvoyltetrahydropterin/6-carboxytetrahydropterin synthase